MKQPTSPNKQTSSSRLDSRRPLRLNRITLRRLTSSELGRVIGGQGTPPIGNRVMTDPRR